MRAARLPVRRGRVVTLAFLVLPIVAIFAAHGPADLVDQLSNPVVQRRARRQR